MKNKNNDDYEIPFKGAMLSKKEGKRIYLALLLALIGVVIIDFLFGIENKTVGFLICLALSVVSYFGIAPKIIKK